MQSKQDFAYWQRLRGLRDASSSSSSSTIVIKAWLFAKHFFITG